MHNTGLTLLIQIGCGPIKRKRHLGNFIYVFVSADSQTQPSGGSSLPYSTSLDFTTKHIDYNRDGIQVNIVCPLISASYTSVFSDWMDSPSVGVSIVPERRSISVFDLDDLIFGPRGECFIPTQQVPSLGPFIPFYPVLQHKHHGF